MEFVCKCLVLICTLYTAQSARVPRATEKIKITTIEEEPYLKKDGSKFTGFIPDLVKKISEKAKFDYEFQVVNDGVYGSLKPNGEWNGMVGEVRRGSVKMAAAPITMSEQRRNVVEFTDSIMSVGNVILYRKDDTKTDTFNNFVELAEQSGVNYGLVKDGMTEQFFKSDPNTTFIKMWNYMKARPAVLVDSNLEGIKKVRESDGNYAMIIENTTAAYWIHKEPCDLKTVGPITNVNHYGFILQKHDQLTPKINDALDDLKAEGELQDLQDKWWKGDKRCGASAIPLPRPFGLAVLALLLAVVSRSSSSL